MADGNVRYYGGEGYGKHALEHYGYNQAVRVGDRIEISGQGEQNLRDKKVKD